MTSDFEQRQRLVKRYQLVSPLEQDILQLCSVMYLPMSRVVILRCVNQSNLLDRNKRGFTTTTLKPVLDKLLEEELLIQEPGHGIECHPLLVEVLTREVLKTPKFKRFLKTLDDCFPLPERWRGGPTYVRSENQFVQRVRISLYQGDAKAIVQYCNTYYQYTHLRDTVALTDIYYQICSNPFDKEWIRELPPDLFNMVLTTLMWEDTLNLVQTDEEMELLREECQQQISFPKSQKSDRAKVYLHCMMLAVEQLIWRGELAEAQTYLENLPAGDDAVLSHLGWIAFLKGDQQTALKSFQASLVEFRRKLANRKTFLNGFSGLFYIFTLLKEGSLTHLQEAEEYVAVMVNLRDAELWEVYSALSYLIPLLQGNLARKDNLTRLILMPWEAGRGLVTFFVILVIYWGGAASTKAGLQKLLKSLQQQAFESSYDWVATEAGEILLCLRANAKPDKKAIAFRQSQGIESIVDAVQVQEPWAISLKALAGLKPATSIGVAPAQTSSRLAWFLTLYSKSLVVQPREQKLTAKGDWSQGRNIALKRLKDESNRIDYLTPQDVTICQQIKASYGGYYGKTDYHIPDRAILSLVGHPLVFWEDAPNTRVEVVAGKPEVQVKQNPKGGLTLELLPALQGDKPIQWIKETPTRVKVIEVTEEHRRIAAILGSQNRLQVPDEAKEQVLTAINAIAGLVTVHSDIGGGLENVREVDADPTPHIHLLPAGEGLKVSLRVRPFAKDGSYFCPGRGGATVIAEVNGEQVQTTRNLLEEKRRANAVEEHCEILNQYEAEEGEWWIEAPEDCLEFLLALHQLGESVILEWPEGEKFKVQHQADMKQFAFNLRRENDWFAASGELQVSNDLVLEMQQLMSLLELHPGRFIPLGDGQFLALTQEFRKRLDELRAFSEKHGKGLRIHPLASLALEEFTDEVGKLKADKHWKEHIKRLKSMEDLQPDLPSTLQAELRDYQIDGFRWMARLAHWGVGACLADDMGLGKTLQALAVILTRAAVGATLVLAPTSVCLNWLSETERFAPTLNIIQLGSGDRQAILEQLQPFDLVICSYGLLQQDEVAELLAKVQWQTIVLDEAQAIKNMTTKRSQAAMKLQGGFKLITTGTPIENHLGELWNLFRFINPGLLGSLERFNERFANPIERMQDKQARNQLKKLIQPFILRRTKNQVLQELPSRTEILLHVEMSQSEMAFYETLRQEAIAKLTASDATAGQKHLQVLAEIMKLRRACCNVQLVKPELSLSSSKLAVFGEVLTELLENRHKALVFSQFVDHLSLIRAYLDEQEITYQYLDGSTPAKERKVRVDAFQRGEGDVFLISLKAGGTGLNLTAADYVLHMDPWWNPAVEDQASDRAHRIGQQRPVTIYRLVTKHTIEEKIVDLHQHKRDLADSLLEGTDVSGKISTEDLLRLMSE
jgi:superfamily II DNA or RNA helicase